MKTNLILLLLLFNAFCFGQNTVYENDFSGYTVGDNLVDAGEFLLQEMQDPTDVQDVTLVIGEEESNNHLVYDTPGAAVSRNTNIRITQEITFKAGVEYTLTARSKGPFARGLRVINVATDGPAHAETNYTAGNNDELKVLWHNHSLVFTPAEDFVGLIAMFRGWNGELMVDDILLKDNLPLEEEEEEPGPEDEVFYVYTNEFQTYSDGENLLASDFMLDVFQLPELTRTLTVNEEAGDKYATLEIDGATASANTLISVSQDIQLKSGIEYTLKADTRGPFTRDIRILEKGGGVMFTSDAYNAKNDAETRDAWYSHTLTFTPDRDFTGQISVLRSYFGTLDINNITLSTLSAEALNQETPIDPDALYQNNFADYTNNQDLVGDVEDFSFVAFKNLEGERTMKVINDQGNNIARYETPGATVDANTNIQVAQQLEVLAGKKYTYSALTKGKFERDIKIINVATGMAAYSSTPYNAMNDDALAAVWQELSVTFIPDADMEILLVINRKWNGTLDIDDIKLVEIPLEEETELDDTADYHNNFANYDEETTVDTDFNFVKVQQEDAVRTLEIGTQDNNSFLRFDTPDVTGDAETLIYTTADFDFVAGTTYTLTVRNRGAYMKNLAVLMSDDLSIAYENRGHNAGASDDALQVWYDDTLTFTPTEDFTGKLAIGRETNGILEIDDLKLVSVVNDDDEDDTPVEEEEEDEDETPVDEEEEEDEDETPNDDEETPEEEENPDGDVTSLEDLASEISIYPLPTTSKINLKLESSNPISIIVSNANGTVVQRIDSLQISNNGVGTLNLENTLNNGVYFMKITDGDKQVVKRIILMR
ncbi:T9SS type A sorting domain-containing protein [Flammeovirga sp. SubArs3]|uniref:T9SS type A sorting domain-containing protein n=1 Tax=Flammeovirga sp. SubArs3 TaxID=2995316 RepID=UPI00248C496C|nr:T9SS type A sorting domain-containing protein [Flammeovirga sp. SubArs3]